MKNKKTIYILGNELVDFDSMPLKLLPLLNKQCPHILFKRFDPTEELAIKKDSEIVFLDTIINSNKVAIYTDLNIFENKKTSNVHDYDLYLYLSLLKKLGKIKKIKIIGVPARGKIKTILQQLKPLL